MPAQQAGHPASLQGRPSGSWVPTWRMGKRCPESQRQDQHSVVLNTAGYFLASHFDGAGGRGILIISRRESGSQPQAINNSEKGNQRVKHGTPHSRPPPPQHCPYSPSARLFEGQGMPQGAAVTPLPLARGLIILISSVPLLVVVLNDFMVITEPSHTGWAAAGVPEPWGGEGACTAWAEVNV